MNSESSPKLLASVDQDGAKMVVSLSKRAEFIQCEGPYLLFSYPEREEESQSINTVDGSLPTQISYNKPPERDYSLRLVFTQGATVNVHPAVVHGSDVSIEQPFQVPLPQQRKH